MIQVGQVREVTGGSSNLKKCSNFKNLYGYYYIISFNSDSGSSSSGSGSGGRSGSEKSSNGDRSHLSDDTKGSPKHSNANSSKSDRHSDKDSSDDSITKRKSRNNHGKVKSDLWEDNPDIYGIRRSARSRKEPDRLKVADSDSSDKGQSHSRKSRKRR